MQSIKKYEKNLQKNVDIVSSTAIKYILQHFQQEQEAPKLKCSCGIMQRAHSTFITKKSGHTHEEFCELVVGQKLYTQSEVDRLIREARLSQTIHIRSQLAEWIDEDDVPIGSPQDELLKTVFLNITEVMKELSKHKEGSR